MVNGDLTSVYWAATNLLSFSFPHFKHANNFRLVATLSRRTAFWLRLMKQNLYCGFFMPSLGLVYISPITNWDSTWPTKIWGLTWTWTKRMKNSSNILYVSSPTHSQSLVYTLWTYCVALWHTNLHHLVQIICQWLVCPFWATVDDSATWQMRTCSLWRYKRLILQYTDENIVMNIIFTHTHNTRTHTHTHTHKYFHMFLCILIRMKEMSVRGFLVKIRRDCSAA